jgi:hypothetical protein
MPYGIRLQRTIFLQVHLWRKLKPCFGHQNFNTTLIYAEIPTEELHRVNAVTVSP